MTQTTQALTLCEFTASPFPLVESISPYCLKIHRALRWLGLDYQRRHATNPAEYQTLNPTGQVPILLVGEEAVCDSTEILHRLESVSGRSLTSGLSAAQAGEAWLWEEFSDTALNNFLLASRWADERNWPQTRRAIFGGAPDAITEPARTRVVGGLIARDIWRAGPEVCWKRFGRTLDQLEARAPQSGFWLGDSLSVADLGLYSQLQELRLPLTPWQDGEISRRARLTAWLDRVDRATREPMSR